MREKEITSANHLLSPTVHDFDQSQVDIVFQEVVRIESEAALDLKVGEICRYFFEFFGCL